MFYQVHLAMNGVSTHNLNFSSLEMNCRSLSIVEDCKAIYVWSMYDLCMNILNFSACVDLCLIDIYSTSQYSIENYFSFIFVSTILFCFILLLGNTDK